MHEKKHYNPAIDLLRIIAILAVILIHTTTRTLELSSYHLDQVPLSLFLNQISRFAVPLFFLISGFVLELNYPFHATYFTYLKKRFNRILIPYILWSTIYYFFVYTSHKGDFFEALMKGDASHQLYFIPTLLIFYLLFPLIHRYYHLFARRWVVAILGLFQLIFLYQDYYVHPLSFFNPINIALLNYYVFFLGIIASHHQELIMAFIKKWAYVLVIASTAMGGFIFFEGRNLYFKTHNYLSFYSQWRPSVFFYTVFLTSTLSYFLSRVKLSPNIKKLSNLSFFVFFIHIIVLEVIWHTIGISLFQHDHHTIQQPWYDPLYFILVATSSFSLAYIAHKIPRLSKLTG